jgi:hypothetical protein
MKQHCNPGNKELRQKLERVTRVTGHVAPNIAFLGLELCANTHLQGRDISFRPRSVHVNPMLPVIEVEEHGGIATGGDNSVCGRFLFDLVALQEQGSP